MSEIRDITATLLGIAMLIAGAIMTFIGLIEVAPSSTNILDWLKLFIGIALVAWGNAISKTTKYRCSTKVMLMEGLFWFLVLVNLLMLMMIISKPNYYYFLALLATLGMVSLYWSYSKEVLSCRVKQFNVWF